MKRFSFIIVLNDGIEPLGMVSWNNYGNLSFENSHIYRIYDISRQGIRDSETEFQTFFIKKYL